MAGRDKLAATLRQQGRVDAAKQVKALRRPTVAAAVLNQLSGSAALAELDDFGRRFRAAQEKLDSAQMRRLGGERSAVAQRVLAAARGSGEDLSSAVQDQIVATVTAAVADPDAAAAVRSGRLTKALSYSGFGEVDLSDAVATWSARPPAARDGTADGQPTTDELFADQPPADRPPAGRRAAEKKLATAQDRRTQAATRLYSSQDRLATAERALAAARQQVTDAERALTDAERALADAAAEVAGLRP